jgi:NhaA family Na+:H+ antiporter
MVKKKEIEVANNSNVFLQFLKGESLSGGVLLFFLLIPLFWANKFPSNYNDFWDFKLNPEFDIKTIINDGLMVLFFLSVGLELKRETISGHLTSIKKASIPILGALGGMLFPALIYLIINYQSPYLKGWAIPTATDIAFAIGGLSILGGRVSSKLKIFLLTLSIVDDIGAIVIIATFYNKSIHLIPLLFASLIVLLLLILNLKKNSQPIIYLISGIFLTFFIHQSGISTSIAGVILAFCIPIQNESQIKANLFNKIERNLDRVVQFGIVPLFVLCNSGINLNINWINSINHPIFIGIFFGLVIGKLFGISLFAFIADNRLNKYTLKTYNPLKLVAISSFGGIGFTMSIFVCNLAFGGHSDWISIAKLAILSASLVSFGLGTGLFLFINVIQKESKTS